MLTPAMLTTTKATDKPPPHEYCPHRDTIILAERTRIIPIQRSCQSKESHACAGGAGLSTAVADGKEWQSGNDGDAASQRHLSSLISPHDDSYLYTFYRNSQQAQKLNYYPESRTNPSCHTAESSSSRDRKWSSRRSPSASMSSNLHSIGQHPEDQLLYYTSEAHSNQTQHRDYANASAHIYGTPGSVMNPANEATGHSAAYRRVPVYSPMSPQQQRRPTTEWKTENYEDGTSSHYSASSRPSYWPAHSPHLDYRRKESLPVLAHMNYSSSSLLSPPGYTAERYRSLSTVEPTAANAASYAYHHQQQHLLRSNISPRQEHSSSSTALAYGTTPPHVAYYHSQPLHAETALLSPPRNDHSSATVLRHCDSLSASHYSTRSTGTTTSSATVGEQHDSVAEHQKDDARALLNIVPISPAEEQGEKCAADGQAAAASVSTHNSQPLRRFSSALRKVSAVGGVVAAGLSGFNPLLSFTPYTPPPILSPVRKGTGLFCHITPSDTAFTSVANSTQSTKFNAGLGLGVSATGCNQPRDEMLAPFRSNCNPQAQSAQEGGMEPSISTESPNASGYKRRRLDHHEALMTTESLRLEEGEVNGGEEEEDSEEVEEANENGEDGMLGQGRACRNDSVSSRASLDPLSGPVDAVPHRKNGLFINSEGAQSGEGCESSFAAELEALRKESAASNRSAPLQEMRQQSQGNSNQTRRSITGEHPICHPRMTMRNRLSNMNEDFMIKKMSTVSMAEKAEASRKESVMSDVAALDAEGGSTYAPETDCIPHINLGKGFQARVKKWADREITAAEREAIPDRDEMVFDPHLIEHLSQTTVAAYEALACSIACPRPGRNKELALHILMENKGNLQSAVMDLLRCDTLDWEQYPTVYNSMYLDVDSWTPADVELFQEYLFESEKDFHHVANKMGHVSVQQCVAFYYTWKKACPDEYRKLRSLRRKRQLLEQQLDSGPGFPQDGLMGAAGGEEEEPAGEGGELDEYYSESNFTASLSLLHQHSNQSVGLSVATPSSSKLNSPQCTPLSTSGTAAATTAAGSTTFNDGHPSHPWASRDGGGVNGAFSPQSHSRTPTSTATNNHPTPRSSQQPSTQRSNGGPSSLVNIDTHRPHPYHPSSAGAAAHLHAVNAKLKVVGTAGCVSKKGAQPQADGFFHCRLCDKRFEKVKSLNAHMKSHAMKARAEAEAAAQSRLVPLSEGGLLQGKQLAKQLKRERDGASHFSPSLGGILGMRATPIAEGLDSSPTSPKPIALNLSQGTAAAHQQSNATSATHQSHHTAAAVAAALGLNNFGDLNSRIAAVGKMGNILSTQDFVSAAMTHLAAVSGNGGSGAGGGRNISAFSQPSANLSPASKFPYITTAVTSNASSLLHEALAHHPSSTLGSFASDEMLAFQQQLQQQLPPFRQE